MDKLEHDPRTKSQIKDALYDFLYLPVQRQFKARIDTIITRNTMIGGHSHKHFVYKGIVYNAETTPPPLQKNRLAPALRNEMEDYLRDQHFINNNEVAYVLRYINHILKSSDDLTDHLRCLPGSVHYPVKRLMATCPCRSKSMSQEMVEQLKAKNKDAIDLMRQRLARNLLF